jgi:hypothetical protein
MLRGEKMTNDQITIGEKIGQDPFSFKDLLGQRLDQVSSKLKLGSNLAWGSLTPAEEYDDKEVKYQAWDIRDYVKAWSFLGDGICISPKSILLLVFNHGYLFRVEFRFLSTRTFGGDPPCEDHGPIFDLVAGRLGGLVEKRDDGSRIVVNVNGDVIEFLYTMDGSTSLIWFVRGSPEKLP